MKKIQRALVSVWRKEGIVPLVEDLRRYNIEILSTGGTATVLTEHGIPVTPVETVTGAPEMLGGRVKTLHPRLHGGILARRDDPEQMDEVTQHSLSLIDLVVVDLYPFEQVIQQKQVDLKTALEHIDIGGPTMLRAAAKNFPDVAVVCDPSQYDLVRTELQQCNGATTHPLRQRLALEAFQRIAAYDGAISAYLQQLNSTSQAKRMFSAYQPVALRQVRTLRYGENPHQQAALYQTPLPSAPSLVTAAQLHGKELSYNNLADADAALVAVQEFTETAVVIVKHQTPCGIAAGDSLASAYQRAYATDPDSASGGVISCNREIDTEFAQAIGDRFIEVLLAPAFQPEALSILKRKKNRRLLALGEGLEQTEAPSPRLLWRSIAGGALAQEIDRGQVTSEDLQIVTERHPTAEEIATMLFAWKVIKHVKSNAVILAQDGQTVGIGAGQMSRVDASRMALMKARSSPEGCVAASDAFFPFPDGLEVLAQAGVRALIQPGGSVRDKEVIAAANQYGVAMAFTGLRAFRH
ncbi:MAG: bifunctional phosphoribosylaminoimidazolecarboxamide formyltransferase/IMP cyclohydrolase [bacterium]|nr:bifunctional phosphoribosylaminoimidazolecarboxamide formyltransferase/IMP cyclohydrolase [bacterium]